MKVSIWIHSPAALTPGTEVPCHWKRGWRNQELIWTLKRAVEGRIISCSIRELITDSLVVQSIAQELNKPIHPPLKYLNTGSKHGNLCAVRTTAKGEENQSSNSGECSDSTKSLYEKVPSHIST